MQRPLIIDCDPGCDDAVMLLMALASPQAFNILGVTTVAGNAPLEATNENALKIVELARRPDIKVFAGCSGPLIRKPLYANPNDRKDDLEEAELQIQTTSPHAKRTSDFIIDTFYIHGENGLAGSIMPKPVTSLQSQHAVDFIIETLMNATQKVTLSISGPMTNIALALVKEPKIMDSIEEIIFMGGSTNGGNITPAAEFNFFVDPHAAHIVVSSGLPMRMLGLNVTHFLVTSTERLNQLWSLKNRVGPQVADMLAVGVENDIVRFGLTGRSIHDACITAYMLNPNLFTFKKMRVLVDYTGEATMGATIANEYPSHIKDQWIWVADTIDSEGVFNLIIKLMDSYKD